MRRLRGWLLVAMAALGVAVLCGSVARANPPEVQKNGIAYAKGHTPGHGKPGGALLLYHNGGVMNTGAAVQAIFWLLKTVWPRFANIWMAMLPMPLVPPWIQRLSPG